MGLVFSPGNISKQDLIDSDYGGPGEDELTPAALQEIVEEQIIGEGTMGIISSISGYSTVGFYEEPNFVVLYDYSDSTIDNFGDSDVGIVVETYPYTSLFDATNEFIDLFGTISDFSEPVIEYGTYSSSTVYEYIATYADKEITGLKEKFGVTSTFSGSLYNSAITSLAQEVIQSYNVRRFVFRQVSPEGLTRNNFSSMSPTRPLATYYTASTATTTTGY